MTAAESYQHNITKLCTIAIIFSAELDLFKAGSSNKETAKNLKSCGVFGRHT